MAPQYVSRWVVVGVAAQHRRGDLGAMDCDESRDGQCCKMEWEQQLPMHVDAARFSLEETKGTLELGLPQGAGPTAGAASAKEPHDGGAPGATPRRLRRAAVAPEGGVTRHIR